MRLVRITTLNPFTTKFPVTPKAEVDVIITATIRCPVDDDCKLATERKNAVFRAMQQLQRTRAHADSVERRSDFIDRKHGTRELQEKYSSSRDKERDPIDWLKSRKLPTADGIKAELFTNYTKRFINLCSWP